jgi:hypothetical protein
MIAAIPVGRKGFYGGRAKLLTAENARVKGRKGRGERLTVNCNSLTRVLPSKLEMEVIHV